MRGQFYQIPLPCPVYFRQKVGGGSIASRLLRAAGGTSRNDPSTPAYVLVDFPTSSCVAPWDFAAGCAFVSFPTSPFMASWDLATGRPRVSRFARNGGAVKRPGQAVEKCYLCLRTLVTHVFVHLLPRFDVITLSLISFDSAQDKLLPSRGPVRGAPITSRLPRDCLLSSAGHADEGLNMPRSILRWIGPIQLAMTFFCCSSRSPGKGDSSAPVGRLENDRLVLLHVISA